MNRYFYSGCLTFSLAALLAGCSVGPDYHLPDISLPAHWLSDAPDAAAPTEKAAIEQEWWKHFNDPVLDKLIAKAASENLDLQIAQARIAESRANASLLRSALLPTVNITGGDERQANRVAFPGPFNLSKPFNIFQAGFDASWEIDVFGGKRRAIEEGAAALTAAEASRDDVRVTLMAEIARTYVDIRRYQAQIDIVNQTLLSYQETVKISKQRFTAGKIAGFDVTQAQAQLGQAQTQLPYYQNLLAQSELNMDVLLGEQPGAAHELVKDSVAIPVSDDTLVLAAPADVIAQRPDIRIAERQLAAATARQGIAVAQFFPKISLSGFLGLLNVNAGDLLQGGSKSWSAGGDILLPILNYGALSANLDVANAREQEAMAMYRKTIIAALSDVERSVTAYTKQQDYRKSLSEAVAQNNHAADIARMRYKEGVSSFTDVLEAERTLYTSQNQMADADAINVQDLIAVYKSLGGGWQTVSPATAP